MIAYLPAFLAGFSLCLVLLIIFHLLWNEAIEEVRYGLGAGSICTGCTLTGLILNDPLLVFGPWVITFSGLVIVFMQWAERRIEAHKLGAQKSGELVGAARGLKQELGEMDAHRPGHDRRN